MCGIVGYIGGHNAKEYLINSLKKLEYRGYDSAGISVMENEKIVTVKSKGKLESLSNLLENVHFDATCGIGHTRWATHGEPSDVNSHPHISNDNKISVVHNGIIENYEEIKNELIKKGYKFASQTDTEVIPNLISYYYESNLLDAVIKATNVLKGSYALSIISEYEKDKIIAVKKDSPLIIGIKDNEKFIASDIPAILEQTDDILILNDDEFAVIEKDNVKIYDSDKKEINLQINKINFDKTSAQKDGFEHFMLKEIYEQPKAVKDTLIGRILEDKKVNFDGINYDDFKNIKKIFIVACGTAYHASKVGALALEQLAKIDTRIDIASEFKYANPVIDGNTLVIVISQSGETADTISALRKASKCGAKTLAITNTAGSTVSREADFVFYTHAGPEISVASTKAYTTQLISLYIFALFMAEGKMSISQNDIDNIKRELLKIPQKTNEILEDAENIKKLSEKICNDNHIFYIGRGYDYATSLEGALKLKEISYIHSETYAGGELKHGPIALIEKGTKVIAVNTSKQLQSKMDANIREIKARGACVLGVVPYDFDNTDDLYDYVMKFPNTLQLLTPVLAIIPLQLLAYYVAKTNGNDIDKPRNLAKSVTVE